MIPTFKRNHHSGQAEKNIVRRMNPMQTAKNFVMI